MTIFLHSEMNVHDSHAIVTMMDVLAKMTFLLCITEYPTNILSYAPNAFRGP
jgi:hypothetical protein